MNAGWQAEVGGAADELPTRPNLSATPPGAAGHDEPTRAPLLREPLPAGGRVGAYELVGVLGRGGMGQVYLARDPGGREVALKLQQLVFDEVERRRFEHEISTLRGIQHPHVVRLLDDGVHEGWRYQVCELIRGTDLWRLTRALPGERLSLPEAVYVLERVGAALAVGHAQGVLHRDVKLSNVMVSARGEVRLIDYGISLTSERIERLTLQGHLVGTVSYLDPNLFAGAGWEPAADVYALGCLAFRVVAGAFPFQGRSGDAFRARLEQPVPSLRALVPAVPPPLAALIERCLSPRREERPSAEALVQELASSGLSDLGREVPERWARQEVGPGPTRLDLSQQHLEPLSGANAPLGPGAQLGPYRVLRELGRGSGGAVFLGQHPSGVRHALKVLPLELLDVGGAAERFERELQALTQLDHPGVVRVHACGRTHAGAPYFAMDLVQGPTLAEARRGGLALESALDLVEEAALALGHCHERGLVHRDVKPENLLLERGHLRLADFGLAKLLGLRSQSLTHTGELLGTASYMAPEQANPALGEVGPASDVFALGAIAFELLRGSPPFQGETTLATLSRLHAGERAPRLGPAEAAPALARVVARALEVEPARRYPEGRAFYRALAEARLAGSSEASAGPLAGGRAGLALTLAGLVCGALGWALGAHAPRSAPGAGPAADAETAAADAGAAADADAGAEAGADADAVAEAGADADAVAEAGADVKAGRGADAGSGVAGGAVSPEEGELALASPPALSAGGAGSEGGRGSADPAELIALSSVRRLRPTELQPGALVCVPLEPHASFGARYGLATLVGDAGDAYLVVPFGGGPARPVSAPAGLLPDLLQPGARVLYGHPEPHARARLVRREGETVLIEFGDGGRSWDLANALQLLSA